MPSLADVRNFARYHLFRRVVDHPAPETELGVQPIGYEPDAYLEALDGYGDRFAIETVAELDYQGVTHPIRFLRSGRAQRTLLVLAGVHGNEQAGLLAVPPILDAYEARRDSLEGVELCVLTPVNPVGAAHLSRYNAEGYDINRDFVRFDTPEARAVRDVFDRVAPDLVVSLHEGPQDATFMFANRLVEPSVARRLLRAMEDGGTTLATEDYFGLTLDPPGYSPIGAAAHAIHRLWAGTLQMMTTGTWADSRGVPEITLESSWRSVDRDARVRGHVDLVTEALLHLREQT